MWTAKRILILVVGLFICMGCYAIYTLAFGVIDGRRTLPEWMAYTDSDNELSPPPGPRNKADKMIETAFGPGCEELRRPLRLWLPDKGIAFSAGDFNIDTKGNGNRVRLAPFSAAIFHKAKAPGQYPEVSILRCDVAILTLDQAVAQNSHTELASRKIIAVELQGGRPGVTLANNRGSAEKSDDIDILVTNGSVFFEDRRKLIWTEGVVCLTDHQSKPPTIIRGKHLEMFLAKETGTSKTKSSGKAQRSNPGADTSNIEKLVLRSDVEMRFWVDARAGFLGGIPNEKNPRVPIDPHADSLKQSERAEIIVKTGGGFVYDLVKELAWFESPPVRDEKNGDPIAPDQVHVQRFQKIEGKDKHDQLTCDRLELQFRRKIALGGAAAQNSGSNNKEIETARATRRGNNDVALALDSERMAAYGTELYYRAGDLISGPLMILKGDPLRSIKDGHTMKCKELHLFGNNRAGEGQKVWAKGPGQIDLLDGKNPAKVEFPMHVLWRDTLTLEKEKEGGQVNDLLTVLGEASFIDDQQKQELHGEKIMIWLRNTQEGDKKAFASGANRQELHRLFALDKVRASSPEFVVRQTNRLTMTFLKEAHEARLPEIRTSAIPNRPKLDNDQKAPVIENRPPTEDKKAKTPLELQGNEIDATIATMPSPTGPKKQLQDLVAKGNVYVFQAGEKSGEKRVDIVGQLLTVKKVSEKGDVLVVHGDKKNPARLELGDTILVGSIITIDQAANRADVDGAGAMDMPSNKNLDGTNASKQNTRVTIYWTKNMTFDGKSAVFSGGVQAKDNAGDAYLQCQDLVATLDKTVSFKDGEKQKQNAKIDRIVCDKNVFIDDRKRDDKKELVQWSHVQGRWLDSEEDGRTRVSGPGQIKVLAKGNADVGIAAPAAAPKGPMAPVKTEWKLTHVKFRDHMSSNTKAATKNAKFYGEHSGIEVFHFPTADIKATMDPDRPPKDGLYLRCEILEVEGKQNVGRTTHVMIAQRNVYFRTEQYLGHADVVKYDEAADVIIFEGLNGNIVRLFEVVDGRARPTNFNSSKVLYNRKTGKMETEGVRSILN